MAKTIGTSWTNIASYTWRPGTGFVCTFYLDARYDGTKNNVNNNESYIYTRLTSVINAGSGSGSHYSFWCDYAPSVSGTSVWYIANETITEGGKTAIKHNDDGTKTIRLNAGGRIDGIGLNFSMGEDVILETIPRATTISNYTGTIGTKMTFSWTKASSTFRHKLTYEIGGTTGTIGENLVDSVEWTPPDSIYQLFPNASSISGKLYLTTYNNGNQIGETKSSTLTLKANESNCNAVISEFSVRDENSKTSALTGDKTTLILTKSTAFVTLSFKTRKYAKIKSVYINDKQMNVSTGSTSNGETSYGIQVDLGSATTGTFKVRITDTRDFTKEGTTTNDVVNYIPLTARAIFKRIAPTTGELGLTFEGDYFGQSFGQVSNSLTISYKYKKTSEQNYSSETTFTQNTHYKTTATGYYSGNGSTKQTIKLAPSFDYKSAYNLVLNVKDKLTDYPAINVIVVKGIPIMWWNGEKVVVNGKLYVADADGNNETDVLNNTKDIWKVVYPVGSYYETSDANFNPNKSWGGTWSLDTKGRVTVAHDSSQTEFNTIGKTGGHKSLQSHTHTGTTSEAGSHVHSYNGWYTYAPGNAAGSVSNARLSDAARTDPFNYAGNHTHTFTTASSGGGNAQNLQPYIVVNRWHRTA